MDQNQIIRIIGAGVAGVLVLMLTSGFGSLIGVVLGLAAAAGAYVGLGSVMGGGEASEPAKTSAPTPAPAQPAAAPAAVAAPAPAAAEPVAAEAAGAHWTDTVKAESGRASAGRGQTALKPSATLSEEDSLRDTVGAWRYGA